MSKEVKLPTYSDTAHCAAILTASPVAIVITSNGDKWESRVWGANDAWRYLAGLMADAALPAINDMEFPPDVERTLAMLKAAPPTDAGSN